MFNKRLQHDFEIPNAGLHRVYLLEESDTVVTWPVICGQGEPVRLSFGNRNNSIYTPILPGTLTWRIVIQNQAARDAIDAVFESIEGDYRVEFYQVEGGITENLIWRGDLLLDQYNEDLRGFPGFVELVANDLASLQGKNYLHTDGFVHTGRETQLQIIKNCVQLLGYELGFACSDAIYEDTMDGNPLTDDPMLQAYADNNWYYPVDQFGQTRLMSAWDVLRSILTSKACRIRQWGGRWHVEQIVDGVEPFPFPEPLDVIVIGTTLQNGTLMVLNSDLTTRSLALTGGSESARIRAVGINPDLRIFTFSDQPRRQSLSYDTDTNTQTSIWASTDGWSNSRNWSTYDEFGNPIRGIANSGIVAEGKLAKFERDTGDQIWRWMPPQFIQGSSLDYAIPAAAVGYLYAFNRGPVYGLGTDRRNSLARLDPATGATIWMKANDAGVIVADAMTCIPGGRVALVGSSTLQIFDVDGTRTLNKTDFGDTLKGLFVDANDNIFIVGNTTLFNVDTEGNIIWSTALLNDAGRAGSSVCSDSLNTIYVGLSGGSDNSGAVEKYDYTGTFIDWRTTSRTVSSIAAHPGNPSVIIPAPPPTWVPPVATYSVDYSDPEYGYIRIPHLAAYNSANYTYEMWVKTPGSSPSPDLVGLISKQPDGTFDREISLYILNTGVAFFGVRNAGDTATSFVTSPASICDGAWHHLAAVKENTGGNDTLRLMLDGVEVATNATSIVGILNDNDVLIGKIAEIDGTGGTVDNINRNFKNRLVELRIWNVARTEAQIAANRSILLNGDEDGLVGYFPLQTEPNHKDMTSTGNVGMGTGRLKQTEDFPFVP